MACKDAGQLVFINHNYPKIDLKASVSAPGYTHYKDHAQSFLSIAALAGWNVNLTGRRRAGASSRGHGNG
ncbi:MAG: hypothetical protein WKF84_09775 [Pyrinomonadaceae bacterium]